MNEQAKKAVAVTPAGNAELFDAKAKITSTHTSELVIALCGPIGSPLHKVAETIQHVLETEFAYDRAIVIRLSDLIQEHAGKVSHVKEYERLKDLIRRGDLLRKEHGASVLAELAVSKIVLDRQRTKEKSGDETYKPRRVCHIIDSIKNQEELEILKLVYRDMLYFIGVFRQFTSGKRRWKNAACLPRKSTISSIKIRGRK